MDQWHTFPIWNRLYFGWIYRIWPVNIWLESWVSKTLHTNKIQYILNRFLFISVEPTSCWKFVIWSETIRGNFCIVHMGIEDSIIHEQLLFIYLLHVLSRNAILVVSWYSNTLLLYFLIYTSNTTMTIN